MSGAVVPQVDIGSLTLGGLSAFAPLLAAFTGDDVSPMAMVQLENLGSLFHVSGLPSGTNRENINCADKGQFYGTIIRLRTRCKGFDTAELLSELRRSQVQKARI